MEAKLAKATQVNIRYTIVQVITPEENRKDQNAKQRRAKNCAYGAQIAENFPHLSIQPTLMVFSAARFQHHKRPNVAKDLSQGVLLLVGNIAQPKLLDNMRNQPHHLRMLRIDYNRSRELVIW
ncbi:uncharacterized protein LOC129724557 [Wyeomyia smithii]|uniref:uncharacterized protein LOC129724557 n=1 Tax=Wyeomyia smithii TaxID=174621 RepID=UPI002467B172|nr:uncharacterized protein LOC129724557 [Wyeomyia smithii]